jgi:hypothetical protein
MPGKYLRRCAICKKYNASYLVDAPDLGGKAYLCYSCWKARSDQVKKEVNSKTVGQ